MYSLRIHSSQGTGAWLGAAAGPAKKKIHKDTHYKCETQFGTFEVSSLGSFTTEPISTKVRHLFLNEWCVLVTQTCERDLVGIDGSSRKNRLMNAHRTIWLSQLDIKDEWRLNRKRWQNHICTLQERHLNSQM